MILETYTCTIPNYPNEVVLSKKRKPVYWKKGMDIPKKYSDPTRYFITSDDFLLDLKTGEKVIKNYKTVGKPRTLTINAQRIYVGIHHSMRVKIVDELHTMFHNAFKQQLPKAIDLTNKRAIICVRFYDVYTTKLPDLDNLGGLFIKCGIDCLTTSNNVNQHTPHKLGIIKDDKMEFVSHIVSEFTNITDLKDRKLEFTIHVVPENFSFQDAIKALKLCAPSITQP